MPEPEELPPDPAEPLDRLPPQTWRDRVERIADATGVTPARVVGGAVAVAVVLVATVWVMRPPAAPAELSLPYASTTAAPAAVEATEPGEPAEPGEGGGAPEVPDELVVHVAGAVRDPGVHRLDPGARVVDAVLAAGGLLPDADEARVNLASLLADGERVYVPLVGEDPPPEPVAGRGGGAAGSAPAQPGGPPLDLNRATAAELEALPGVGPATAAAIIEHRDRIGSFTSVDQLIDVRGIGPAKLEQIRPAVRV